MDHQVRDDTQPLEDNVSLTSLENDATDEFDRFMIQNARDERRRNDALHGKVQPFRKARTHPRVGVTLENLERHNAAAGPVAHTKFESPPSSSGSTRSDPALHPPPQWGRKARTRRNWMRTITSDEEQTPRPREDDPVAHLIPDDETPRPCDADADADAPRPSVEDSPLSRKSTPVSTRLRRDDDWDFDFNEASLIASTPYLPRSTVLDDIRQREIESLKEQGVTTSRLGQIRESSPEEMRRPPSASSRSGATQANGTAQSEQDAQGASSPDRRLRMRTNSWKTATKSPAATGVGAENSPIVVYKKSLETVGVVDRGLLANAHATSNRPFHRREDSHDLLRRLARVSSSTPSPGRTTTPRPQTASSTRLNNSSQTMPLEKSPDEPPTGEPAEDSRLVDTAPQAQSQQLQENQEIAVSKPALTPTEETGAKDVDATPMPVEQSILNPKTPVVTGAWVDTPRPATAHRPADRLRSPSKSPKKGSPSKQSPRKPPSAPADDKVAALADTIKPKLPGSALEAILGQARTHGRQRHEDFGDSTINSLEELIAPRPENPDSGEPDEDTLQDLQIPTGTPRNEAERQRRQELLQLQRMNERLRAARTSIRDTSRGIKRVEDRIEHAEEITENGERVRVVYRNCPCSINGGHQCAEWSAWKAFKSLFYDEKLKPKRRGWGLTILSIVLITFLAWLVLENTAWYVHLPLVHIRLMVMLTLCSEIWCNYEYASTQVGYGVTWGAPEYPFVIPTVIYRNFMKPWWIPLWALLRWCWRMVMGYLFDTEQGRGGAGVRASASRAAGNVLFGQEARVIVEDDGGSILGMAADELIR